jgi:cytoskeleton protein RodZ
MNTQQENIVSEMDSSTAKSSESIGTILREARERLGLSVNDVANRIKFAPKQIEWLEADDYVRLPEAAFVRGFVRSYARLVELDPVVLLDGLPPSHVKAAAVEVKSVDVPMPSALSARRYNIVLLATGLIIAVLVAIFERMNDRAPDQAEPAVKTVVQQIELPAAEGVSATAQSAPVAAAMQPQVVVQQPVRAVPVPSPSTIAATQTTAKPIIKPQQPVLTEPVSRSVPPSTPPVERVAAVPKASVTPPVDASGTASNASVSAANAVDHALLLEFDEDAWVEVKGAEDKILTSRMHTAGSLMRVTGKAPLLVVIGNARAVRLFDNGKKVNLERYTTAEVAKVKLQ